MHHFEEQKLAENKETIVETDMSFLQEGHINVHIAIAGT